MKSDDLKIIIEYLEFIGLKGYEGRAYLLLELGEETAPHIATKADIPLPRIYDVLESLMRKGLVEVRAGRPRRYRALPPDQALNRYVRMYIKRIASLNTRVVKKLKKMYCTGRSTGPSIWISYSSEMSIERVRSIINNMYIDGFASLTGELVDEIANTLHKSISRSPEAIFALTLLSQPSSRDYERLLELDNIDIRFLPTGIVRAIEIDFSNAALLGDTYTLFTSESDLLIILNDTYYYGYWRFAKRIKGFHAVKGRRYKTVHHWLSLTLIDDGLREGYNALIKVNGYMVKTRKPAEVTGYVREIRRTLDNGVRSIIVEKENGEIVSVGGLGASVEDIEGRYIEVEFH